MPGRKGGMVYHWKHGYIPLDHYAALQKAHGSQIGAARIMQRHDIHDGPKSLHSVDLSNGGKGKPSAPSKPAAKPAAHAKVRDLPADGRFTGVHSETHMGERVTVKRGREFGTIETHINGHVVGKGYGTKNADAVKHLDSAKGTVEHAKANPGNYTNGLGEHSYGMKLTPKESKPINPVGKDHRDMSSAEKIRAAEIMHGTGSKQHQAAQAKFGGKTAGSPKSTANAETSQVESEVKALDVGQRAHYVAQAAAAGRAEFVPAGARGNATAEIHVDGVKVGQATSLGRFVRPASGANTHVTHKLTPAAGYEPPRERAAVKPPAGLDTNVSALKGLEVAMGRDRAEKTAASMGYERNLDGTYSKVSAAPDVPKSPAASAHTARAEELRAAAAKKRAEADRIASGAGVNDRAAAMLSGKTHARQVAKDDSALRRFSEKQREAKALESKAHLAEGRAKTAAEKQAAADLGVTAAKLSPGDMVQHKGSVHMVTKVNRTTVSVPSIVGGSWEDKLSIGQVSKHVKVADMKESTLRTLMSRAKGDASLQGVYMAELKRRGLSL